MPAARCTSGMMAMRATSGARWSRAIACLASGGKGSAIQKCVGGPDSRFLVRSGFIGHLHHVLLRNGDLERELRHPLAADRAGDLGAQVTPGPPQMDEDGPGPLACRVRR